jgi:AbrB family looped-hinge helix DNA binding protein
MKTTIDSEGRILLPEQLRGQLGLAAGQSLEVSIRDGRLEIEVCLTAMTLAKRGKGVVAVSEEMLPPLTADQVRDTLRRVRR